MAHTSTDPNQWGSLMDYLANGGSLDNFNTNDWEEVEDPTPPPTDYVDKDGKLIVRAKDGHPDRIERAEQLKEVVVTPKSKKKKVLSIFDQYPMKPGQSVHYITISGTVYIIDLTPEQALELASALRGNTGTDAIQLGAGTIVGVGGIAAGLINGVHTMSIRSVYNDVADAITQATLEGSVRVVMQQSSFSKPGQTIGTTTVYNQNQQVVSTLPYVIQ